MRGLVIKLALFFGMMEGLGKVDFLVLLSGVALAIAVIVCADRFLASESSR